MPPGAGRQLQPEQDPTVGELGLRRVVVDLKSKRSLEIVVAVLVIVYLMQPSIREQFRN